MEIQYDIAKNTANIRKHKISSADCEGVFYDPMAITIEDRDQDEFRQVTLGMDSFSRLLVVCWTECGTDCIRIISARRADPSERKAYEG
ncbi:MAG: BrnT family toxin [Gammaproteobacteria bacterium SHHR-1]|uniref:BrnT family toxin n=1 Tax=Magnetovirga frankeli TaxID=947516 RepID=UPI0012935302|nr:BrnT family toxin [gamma proteobacterium SS-5]